MTINEITLQAEDAQQIFRPLAFEDRQKLEFQVLMEEYKACRTEIMEHLKFQAQAVALGATAVVAFASIMTSLLTKPTSNTGDQIVAAWIALIIPLISFVLGMWMVHKDMMIVDLASYIWVQVKPRVEAICKPLQVDQSHPSLSGLLNWDAYKGTKTYGSARLRFRSLIATFAHLFFGVVSTIAVAVSVRILPMQVLENDVLIPYIVCCIVDGGLMIVFALSAASIARQHSKFGAEIKTTILDTPIGILLRRWALRYLWSNRVSLWIRRQISRQINEHTVRSHAANDVQAK